MRSLDEILKGGDLNIFLIRCSKDFKYWCENVFNMDIQPFHMEWFYAIQENNRVAITAPTGFGKTQLVIAYLLWRCWFETNKDFLIVSKAIHQSVKILDRIIDIIDQNELLSDIMPDNTTKTKTWTKTSIKTKTRCSISCKPYSENIKSYHADFVLCTPGNTKIETPYGQIDIKNIKVGDYVITHKNRPRKVKQLFRRKWRGKIYEISANGTILKLTSEHPVLTNNMYFKKASKLKIGDKLYYPISGKIRMLRVPKKGEMNIPYILINSDLARVFGLYAAEGSINKSGIVFTFSSKETEYIDFVKDTMFKYFNKIPTIDNHNPWATGVIFSSISLRDLFYENFDHLAKNKKTPSIIFNSPDKVKAAYLLGVFEGDGSKSKNGSTLTVKSEKLVDDVIKLASDLRLSFTKYTKKRDIYSVHMSAQSMRKLRMLWSSNITRKYAEMTINNIKVKRSHTDVYNIEVEEDNTYIANNILVHNCDEAASYRDHDVFFRFVVTRTNAKKGKVICISTPEDITDLMSVLALRKTYWSRTYPAIIEGKALWPVKFGLEELERIRNDIGDEAYQREYMCNPRAQAANAIFPADIIENCFDYESRFMDKKMFEDSTVIIGADFAISSGQDADFDSYIVLEKHNGACYIRHGETHKGFPINSKVDKLVELYQKYGALKIYLDPSSIGAAVLERLRNRGIPVMAPDFTAANRNRMLISIREMLEDRKVLIPRDINCFLTMKFTNTLVQELLAFRETKTLSRQDKTFQSKSKHDDTVMSLALACLGAQNAREFLDFVAV